MMKFAFENSSPVWPTMSLFQFLLQSSWRLVAIATLTGIISGGSSAAIIAVINYVIKNDFNNSPLYMVLGFMGLVLLSLITNFISQITLIQLAQQAIFDLRLRLAQRILAADLPQLESLGAARLLATLTDDVQAVSDAVRLIPFIFVDMAIAGGCFIYITFLSWQVTVLALIMLVLCLFIYRNLLRYARTKLALAREEQDSLYQHFQAVTNGTKELKLHYQRRQAFLQEDLWQTASAYRQYNVEGLSMFAIISNWGKMMFFFMIGLALFILPEVMSVSPSMLSGYILSFTYMVGPIDSLINRLPVISRSAVALEKIQSLNLMLNDRAEKTTPPAATVHDWQTLQLKRVTHTYGSDRDDRRFTLGPLNLSLHPGEIVFLVGGNGSGKSTLAKIITGLYTPENGEIWFDNIPITDSNREWYRQHFSVVFADFFLFARLLGLQDPNLEQQATKRLRQLQLDHKVTIESGTLSTTALSQGQRKRLALLTAYLEDRPIYLFDEWASDQDPVFKDLFYRELLPQLRDRGKAIIVISHDDHYFHLGDRLIKLDYGQLEYERSMPYQDLSSRENDANKILDDW